MNHFVKSQRKSVIVGEFLLAIVHVRDKSGKTKATYHFQLVRGYSQSGYSICLDKWELCHYVLCCGHYLYIPCRLGSIFFAYFCSYVQWGSGKMLFSLSIREKLWKVREFDSRIGYEP